jgi:3-hydroxyisobutyrate dehydrogenase-like beta-hydroxyacid dehydrogenase
MRSFNGSYTYSIPLMGKERLLQAGTLQLHVGASAHALSVAKQVLSLEHDKIVDDGEVTKSLFTRCVCKHAIRFPAVFA